MRTPTCGGPPKTSFNPGAVVRDGRVHLLVRGEDNVGRFAGTSRIGLATSDDGVRFTLAPDPVLQPDGDFTEFEAKVGAKTRGGRGA